MSHSCHPFWKCYKTLTFCSLLTMCTIPCACHAKRHLNLQMWSEPLVFLTCWLRNVLRAKTACTCRKVLRTRQFFLHFWLRNVPRATTACTFLTSQLLKVVRSWCVLYILTWKCASRHNGVQFFISHLASWLRTSGATNHWKNTVFREFPTFSRTWIFFLLRLSLSSSLLFSSLTLPISAFHLSILSEVWLLNFLR